MREIYGNGKCRTTFNKLIYNNSTRMSCGCHIFPAQMSLSATVAWVCVNMKRRLCKQIITFFFLFVSAHNFHLIAIASQSHHSIRSFSHFYHALTHIRIARYGELLTVHNREAEELVRPKLVHSPRWNPCARRSTLAAKHHQPDQSKRHSNSMATSGTFVPCRLRDFL